MDISFVLFEITVDISEVWREKHLHLIGGYASVSSGFLLVFFLDDEHDNGDNGCS